MAGSYVTIAHDGNGTYEEKKSRFLGEAHPAESEDEIREILESIRKKYYDARHHCYAYVLGTDGSQKRFSDDGEPSGTAGAPILKVLEGADCTNTLIVVTRYFGGTLLGTGGLVRSYTAAAKAALSDAGVVTMEEGIILHLTMDYSLLDKVNYLLQQNRITPEKVGYTDRVSMDITVPAQEQERIETLLTGAGAGRIGCATVGKGFFCFPNE